jgi:HlyD family secretion protein
VIRIDPAVQEAAVAVDVELDGQLPKGARPDLSVDGTIEIERLENVVYMDRPVYGQSDSVLGIFKLQADGITAVRAAVKLGRSSVSTIEVLDGLHEGDKVILSDMSRWEDVDRISIH